MNTTTSETQTEVADTPEQQTSNAGVLTQQKLDVIISALGSKPSEAECSERLKKHWPDVRFIFCDDDDLGEKEPFWQAENFSVHLIAASLGCASFTYQPEQSAGLVIGIIE